MKISYLSTEQIVAIHDTLIEEFGGTLGLRDPGLLESAAMQPQQSFGGEDLYPTPFDKAAAYAFFIFENQPFLDGKKRAAASAAGVFLDINGYEIDCPPGGIYEVMMQVANKKLTREKLAEWFEKNSVRKKRQKR